MAYRLEVDIAYNCRPNKRERRTKDGRLLKCLIYRGATFEECLSDARKTQAVGTPGYSEVIAVRGYDDDTFRADPLNCEPAYQAAAL